MHECAQHASYSIVVLIRETQSDAPMGTIGNMLATRLLHASQPDE